MKPSIGRIVHYHLSDASTACVSPAIVTGVHESGLSLTVFFDPKVEPAAEMRVVDVPDREGAARGTRTHYWAWPPRA